MTREEAIKHLSEWMDEKMWRCFGTIDREAIGMAIEALSADTVSREFYEDAVKANIRIVIKNRELKEQIESADAVQGEWIIRENGNKECSLCGHERQDGWDYFCGYCGARMKGGAE